MVFRYLDRANQALAGAPGTGPLTLGGARAGYQSFSQAGANNGDTFSYLIVDGLNWEYGLGTYSSTGINGTLARTTVTNTSSQSTTPISVSSAANVSAILRGEDLGGETSSLENLTDVNINEATLLDGQVLTWNLSSGKWVATTPSGGGGGSSIIIENNGSSLGAITTLNVTNPSALTVSGGVGALTLPGVTALSGLSDVSVTEGSGINGYTLNWNNSASKWEAVAPVSPTGGSIAVSNNGTSVDTAATTLNFVNATSITTSSHDVTITLPTGGGGGGSGLFNQVLSATPTKASTGFNTTWVNQGSCTVADSDVGVCLTGVSNSNNVAGLITPVPSTPYTATALLAVTRVPQGYDGVGIGFYDGSNKIHALNLVSSNGGLNFLTVGKWTTATSFDANDYSGSTQIEYPTPIWLQVADDGTNVKFSFSYDGANFLTVFSISKASGWLGGSGYTNLIFFTTAASTLNSLNTLLSWTVT